MEYVGIDLHRKKSQIDDGLQTASGTATLPGDTARSALHPSQEAGMRADLVVGGHLPDLELPDHRRQSVRLSKLAAGYPLILSFCRGYW
jgi:hypothetical protein